MKKIDFMLKLLFVVVFANVSYGQGLFLEGGANCEEAVPIDIGEGYNADHAADFTNWYSFVAPCDGRLTVADGRTAHNNKRIYSGVCGSLTEQDWANWENSEVTYDMSNGEEAFITLDEGWNGYTDFHIRYENPDCKQPRSLEVGSMTYSTAFTGWFAGDGDSETDYEVVYGLTGFDPEVGGLSRLVGGDDTFLMLTGLAENTCYDFYVRAICGEEGVTSCFLTGPFRFCTPAKCPTPTSPFVSGITNEDATLNWGRGAAESEYDIEWGPEGFLLGSVDGTFVPFHDSRSLDLSGLEADECYDFYVRSICNLEDGTFRSVWVGPIEFCTQKNCLDPSDLSVVTVIDNGATVAWDANNDPEEEEWNIQYGNPGFTLGMGTTVTGVPSNPFTLTELPGGRTFCYYVQAVCSEDEVSNWVGLECFTTPITCDKPNSLVAGPHPDALDDPTQARLSWNADDAPFDWTLVWGPEGFDFAGGEGEYETPPPFGIWDLEDLIPGETYCYYVRRNCTEDDEDHEEWMSSTWSGPVCWTQPEICVTPIAMNVINITNTAANVTFFAPGTDEWNFEWGAPCFTPGVGEEMGSESGTDEYPYYMTGLEHSTPYEVYVQSECGADGTSNWAGPFLFGTDIANDNPCRAETLVLDGPALRRHNFDATVLPGETALAPPSGDCYGNDGWCSGDGVDRTVWFKFVAPGSGQAKLSTYSDDECITNGPTEVAMYFTGDCLLLDNFELQFANSLAPDADGEVGPYGSEFTLCGLTPGETYYVMVNPVSFVKPDVMFSIELKSIEDAYAGLGLNPTICSGGIYDMFESVAGESSEGRWYIGDIDPINRVDDEVNFPDGSYMYDAYYVADNGCSSDVTNTTITTVPRPVAGADGFYTACNTYDIILSDHLVGMADAGGTWEYLGEDTLVSVTVGGLFRPLDMAVASYEFRYIVSNTYCPADTAYVTIILNNCLGVDENAVDAMIVFPNPVLDVVTVQNLNIEGDAVIELLDVNGKLVLSNQVSNLTGNYTIDMSNVESGVYFIKVTSDSAVQKTRVVKQ